MPGVDFGDEGPRGGQLNAAIARAVVRIQRERTGRGPMKAQAFFRNNIVVVVLHEVMTKGERTLAASKRSDAVLRVRRELQETMRAELVGAVERLTGCKVEAFMSANNVDPDMTAELFVLDRDVPKEPPAPPRS